MAVIYRLSHIIKERYTDVGVGGSHFSFPVGVAHTYGAMVWEHETVPKPTEAQLISSSLGTNNEILLRYLYKGKNTLVILDVKTKKIKSIVTIKKGQNSFKIN